MCAVAAQLLPAVLREGWESQVPHQREGVCRAASAGDEPPDVPFSGGLGQPASFAALKGQALLFPALRDGLWVLEETAGSNPW